LNGNDSIRLDSGFFNKQSIEIDNIIKKGRHIYLQKNEVVSGPFGSTIPSEYYLDNGDVPFIRIENIKDDFFINNNKMVYISNNINNKIKNSQLFEHDIIMSKVGNSIGHFAMVDEDIKTCNISENNLGIKLGSYSIDFKYYLCTYLNSELARHLILRRISGNAQPKINVSDMLNIPIPEFSNSYYKTIHDIVNKAYKLRKEADCILHDTIKKLEDELNYDEKQISNNNISTNTLKGVLDHSKRIDAEFYQEKYNYYEKIIDEYHGGSDTIKNTCSINTQNFVPKVDNYYKYIELADIKNNGEIEELEELKGEDLPTRARRLVKEGDIIISSIEGSLDSCSLIREEQDNCICSTGFYVIKSETINSETLFTLFKTSLYQEILKRYASGTILTSVNTDDFETIKIPIIDKAVQTEIQDSIKKMYEIRNESKMCLKLAEESVKIAIEKNEEDAISYIKQ